MAEDLSRRLGEMRDRCDGIGRDGAGGAQALLAELRALAACFDGALHDVAALRLPDALGRQVPGATEELHAVARQTAAATETILDECEKLEAAFADRACSPAVSAAATRIYEACAFQDIVGQRLAKVVRTLQGLEGKTASILRVFGPPPADVAVETPPPFLDGPQCGAKGMDQHAVDAMLADAR